MKVIFNLRVLLEVPQEHSLSTPNLVIIFLKSQLLQFPMHLIHNFSLKIYHLKCLKSVSETLLNISFNLIE